MKKNSISIFNDLLDDNFPFFQIKNDFFNLRTNIKELENEYLFEINVAGLTKENINIDVEDGYLVISANENNENENKENNYLRKVTWIEFHRLSSFKITLRLQIPDCGWCFRQS